MKVYRLVSILSLDVVAGSVISALFFSRILSATTNFTAYLALALTVWIIYATDHLLDARSILHPASTPRHQFHQTHFKNISRFVIIASVVDFIFVLFLPRQLIYAGASLAALVILFLMLQSSIPWIKELFIALIYTSGILIPSFFNSIELKTTHYILIFQFIIAAFINLLIFSWIDSRSDRQDGLNSIVMHAGKKATSLVIGSMIVLQFLLTGSQVLLGGIIKASLIIFFMTILLLIIFVKRQSAETDDTYRFVGDAVFMLPMIYML